MRSKFRKLDLAAQTVALILWPIALLWYGVYNLTLLIDAATRFWFGGERD